MSTESQNNKRLTRQVRMSNKYHKMIKFQATDREITISRLLDEILQEYFRDKEVAGPNSFS